MVFGEFIVAWYITVVALTSYNFIPTGLVAILVNIMLIVFIYILLMFMVNNLIPLRIFEKGISISNESTDTKQNFTVKEIFIPWKDVHELIIRPRYDMFVGYVYKPDEYFHIYCKNRDINLNEYTEDIIPLIELLYKLIPERYNEKLLLEIKEIKENRN